MLNLTMITTFGTDHDEDTHGPIDRDDLREQVSEGFIYSCYDRNGR